MHEFRLDGTSVQKGFRKNVGFEDVFRMSCMIDSSTEHTDVCWSVPQVFLFEEKIECVYIKQDL